MPARSHGEGHPDHPSRTYWSWSNMQDRCRNPKNPRYADYGGRGITVHPWWEDFIHFKMDMGDRPPGTSIDR